MAVLTLSDLHRRVCTAILAALPAWHASQRTHDDFSRGLDGAEIAHLGFSVALPASEWRDGAGRDAFAFVSTQVSVRYLYLLRPEERDAAYREGLDAEAAMVRAVLGTPGLAALKIQLAGPVRRQELSTTTGPMLLGTLDFVCHHTVALT